jgi:hypothetical protein
MPDGTHLAQRAALPAPKRLQHCNASDARRTLRLSPTPCSQPSEPHQTPNMTRGLGPSSEPYPHSNITQCFKTLGALRRFDPAPKHVRSLGAKPPPSPLLHSEALRPFGAPSPLPPSSPRASLRSRRGTLTRGIVPSGRRGPAGRRQAPSPPRRRSGSHCGAAGGRGRSGQKGGG